MRRILFITNEYPPISSPTSIVVKPVIDTLKKEFSVYVLSIGSKDIFDDSEKVYVVNGGLEKKYANKKNGLVHLFLRLNLRLKQFVNLPLYPVYRPFLQRKLEKAALSICKRNNIDCIVSVCFPQEAVAAGCYVKKKLPCIKYVPYIIDAFSGGTLPKYLPATIARRRKIEYESSVTGNADAIIAMESAKSFYSKTDIQTSRYYLNPALLIKPDNKYVEAKDLSFDLNKDKINVLYTGYLYYPDRDPSYIIQLLSELKITNLSLTFVGKCDKECEKIIQQEKKTFNGDLNLIPFVPHDELNHVLKSADVFLNLGVANSNAISGKIFEYMAFGKPILSICFDENDAALPYLKKYPLSCLINKYNDNYEDVVSKVGLFLENSIGKIVPYEIVEKLFYSSTPAAFCDCIKNVLGEVIDENRDNL